MVTRGHSWSFVVTRGHSLSLVVTRGHSWSLVCTFRQDLIMDIYNQSLRESYIPPILLSIIIIIIIIIISSIEDLKILNCQPYPKNLDI